MSTLVTPSARSHERVKGRWIRDIEVGTRKDMMIYYAKQVFGTPIPWLISAFVCLAFLSRAGLEMAAWSSVALSMIYIFADRFSRTREFTFFRVGSDFFLLGYALIAVAGALFSDSALGGLANLGSARWVLLLYSLTYCWELFPGLNRVYFLMISMAVAASLYGIWQHFMGLDLIRDLALTAAPISGHAYFMSTGFFGTPEIYGTMLATILPFPAAAFLLSHERSEVLERWLPLAIVFIIGVAVMWTYRPGLWTSAVAGLVVTMLMGGRNIFVFLGSVAAFVGVVTFAAYDSPASLLDSVQQAETTRAERQRAQINTQVQLWQNSTWIGVGPKAEEAANYDPGTGNVYFQILAQTGVLGVTFYLLFILAFLLSTYRIYQEIPQSHHWHRVLIAGGLGSQVAFHMAGLYWSTVAEALTMNLFILILASIAYLSEHYSRGLVPDDCSL